MAIYGYIRVSTHMQTVENQRFEILSKGWTIDKWFEETKSGTIDYSKRVLLQVMKKARPGDMIVCSELSRLGRSLYMIIEVLNYLLKHKIKLYAVKENFMLDDSINSKVLSFAFGLSAEIERNLISQRTKEALALKKSLGIRLGRPIGAKNKHHILEPHREYIIKRKLEGKTNNYIKTHLHCHINTLKDYITILEEEGRLNNIPEPIRKKRKDNKN